jgi:ABC-type multidrug transport system permease subunit
MRFGKLLTQSNPDNLLKKFGSSSLEEALFKICRQNESYYMREIENSQNNKDFSKTKSIQTEKSRAKYVDFAIIKVLLWRIYLLNRRNPLILILFLVLPISILIVTQLGFGQKPINIPIGIHNAEVPRNASQIFIDKIDRNYIHLNFYNSKEKAISSVVNGKNWFALSIAQNFSDSIETRILDPNEITDEEIEDSKIKLYADMSNSVIASHINQYLTKAYEKFFQNYSTTLGYNPNAFSLPIIVEQTIYGSIDPIYTEYLLPGILLGTFHNLPMILAAFVLITERRDGHLERSFVAGVKPIEILIAQTMMLFVDVVLQTGLSMFVAFFIFKVHLNGSFLAVYALCALQGLQGMAFGIFVSNIFYEEFSILVSFFTEFRQNFYVNVNNLIYSINRWEFFLFFYFCL